MHKTQVALLVPSRHQQGGPLASAPQPPEQKSNQGQGQHHQGEATGQAIGQALDRGLAALGPLHQLDDAGHGTVATAAAHLQHQGGLQVEAAGSQFRARLGLQGQGLAGEGRDVQRRAALPHQGVHRHPIARQQPQPIPRPQPPHPHRPRRLITQQQQGRIGL